MLNKPIVGMAPTPDGGGYWLVASDGGVFSYGDATFYGSTGNLVLNKPIVGMASTPDGGGYWLVASDGGVFTFGDARFYGSTGNLVLNKPIVGMVPTARRGRLLAGGLRRRHLHLRRRRLLRLPRRHAAGVTGGRRGAVGRGRRLLDAGGGRHRAGFRRRVHAATGGRFAGHSPRPAAPMTSIVSTADGQGYLMVDRAGQVFSFGDAPYFGDVASTVPGYSGSVVGIAASAV